MDYDLDTACFPIRTSDLLVWFTGMILVHLMNSPHIVKELSHLILVGDMGWKVFAKLTMRQKREICVTISEQGQMVFPAQSSNCSVRGRCVITLKLPVDAFESNRIYQMVLYAYGIKGEDCDSYFRNYTMPQRPIAKCRWDFGLKCELGDDKIPLFKVDQSVVRGMVFPMLLQDAGSVEIPLSQGRLIVYQHLLHVLKALSNVQISMPASVGALAHKMQGLRRLVRDLQSVDASEFSEIRVELSVQGYHSFADAAALASRLIPLDQIPDGVVVAKKVRVPRYLRQIDDIIANIDKDKVFAGNYKRKLTAMQKHHLARLFNALGFSMGRWVRHLQEPTYPSLTITQGEIHSGDPRVPQRELEEIASSVRTRNHPRRPDLICAITKTGGCSKAFPNVKELAAWIGANHRGDWKLQFHLLSTAGPTPQRKTTTTTLSTVFQKEVSDLTAAFNHDVIRIGSDDFLLFDVPADHHCLFHSLAGVLKPLYTTTRPPTYREVRAAVISFYNSCPQTLRQFFEGQWPGVSTMSERADTLERLPNEWGENMDIQAAANFYNVEIDVAVQTRTRQVGLQEVHSFNQNARRSRSARKSPRLIYFDGKSHFKVGHRLF